MTTTIAPTARPVNASPDFVVAIQDAHAADFVTPFMLGCLDAQAGEIACPEMYYIKRGDMLAYCEGFESIAGRTLTTAQFLEPQELAEDMMDREWHARGMW